MKLPIIILNEQPTIFNGIKRHSDIKVGQICVNLKENNLHIRIDEEIISLDIYNLLSITQSKTTVGNTPPTNPSLNDVWIDTN